jgi:hypothetical protein
MLEHPARPDLRPVEKHMAKADRKNSVAAFLSLEAKYYELAAKDAEAQIAKVEARVKDICKQTIPDRDPFGEFDERFIFRMRRRSKSSADFAEYVMYRDLLLNRLREISEEKHRRAAEKGRRQRAVEKSERNKQMAEEFLQKRKLPSNKSESALKAEIGRKHHGLGRSASIEAIKRGLKSLKA